MDFCYWKAPLVELESKNFGVYGFGSIGRPGIVMQCPQSTDPVVKIDLLHCTSHGIHE